MQFDLLRLSMLPRAQLDAFERHKADGSEYTREEWLRAIFSEKFSFLHFKEHFNYEPEPDTPDDLDGLIVGRIGRQISVSEAQPPEGALRPVERTTWKAALFLIDPTAHDDGQKVAVEVSPIIGRPQPVLQSLANHINLRSEPFHLEVNTISDPQSFWDFVKANRGQITSVTFEFVAPNMFGHEEDYVKEMNDLKEKERVQKLKMELQSKEGLILETDRVERAVDYAAKGGGAIQAKTKRKTRFSSKDKTRKVRIDKKLETASFRDLIYEVFNRIFRS